jgi:hypothetical protein
MAEPRPTQEQLAALLYSEFQLSEVNANNTAKILYDHDIDSRGVLLALTDTELQQMGIAIGPLAKIRVVREANKGLCGRQARAHSLHSSFHTALKY